jgi:hypothetical protein
MSFIPGAALATRECYAAPSCRKVSLDRLAVLRPQRERRLNIQLCSGRLTSICARAELPGIGCPCIRLTRRPVDEPKMLSISYSPSAGAGSPGSCSARSAIPCPRALRARECARAPWSGITHSLDLLRPTTQAACGSRRDHHLQACKLARNPPRLTFGPPSNYERCRKDGKNACIGLCEP